MENGDKSKKEKYTKYQRNKEDDVRKGKKTVIQLLVFFSPPKRQLRSVCIIYAPLFNQQETFPYSVND